MQASVRHQRNVRAIAMIAITTPMVAKTSGSTGSEDWADCGLWAGAVCRICSVAPAF